VDWDRTKSQLLSALRSFAQQDLRWAYLINAGLVVIGAVVNIFMPHGWTIWPMVGAAGIMVMVNEATDRNAVGIPPFQVYIMIAVATILWLIGAMLLSALGPLLLIGAMIPMVYYGVRGYLRQLEHDRLVAERKREGRCVHCGEKADPQYMFCTNCGLDLNALEPAPKPKLDRLSKKKVEHARQILAPQSPTAEVSLKEQQLLKLRRSNHKPPDQPSSTGMPT